LQFQNDSSILKRIKGYITFNSQWNDMSGIERLKEAGFTYDVVKFEDE